jgi:hypothetical protein
MKLRPFATTLTIGSFILIAVTGFCLLIHVRSGFIIPIHELGSIVFLFSAILHCVANFEAIKNYLRKNSAKITIAFFILVTILAIIPFKGNGGNPRKAVSKAAPQLLVNLNAHELAIVTHKNTFAVVTVLQASGIADADTVTPIAQLSKNAGKNSFAVLAALLPAAGK